MLEKWQSFNEKCYRYNPYTFEFISEDTCALDPMESEIHKKNVYSLSAECTFKQPLKEKKGYINVFNVEKDEWEYKELPKEKTQEELQKEWEDSLTEEQKINIKISKLQSQLNSTDWYVTRYSETGKEIPQNIRDERESLRNEISKLKDSLK